MNMESETYEQLLHEGESCLQDEEIADAKWDAFLLLEYVSGMNRSSYFLKRQDAVPLEEKKRYLELIQRRAEHIPLQYLTGGQEFMGLDFEVTPDVLIPRQDTECLIETALPFVEGKKVLDMCTGSGCIAISLQILGKSVTCDAADLSKEALKVAERNAVKNHAQIQFIQSDLFENVEGKYDVIVSNPPYIPPHVIEGLMEEVRVYEPRMALDGGVDGLDFYRRITKESVSYLVADGFLLYEIGCEQAADVMSILAEAGFTNICCRKDYAGKDRVVYGKKAGGKTCLID